VFLIYSSLIIAAIYQRKGVHMNSFSPSERMRTINMPPIAKIMARITELKSSGRRIYSMAQAAPWYSPPSSVLDDLACMFKEPSIHRYCPDPGFPWARKAVTEDFRRRREIDLDPDSEIHLTCGASQAFLSALLTASMPGDSVAVSVILVYAQYL
jgi:alanine-synthesizing transaminase